MTDLLQFPDDETKAFRRARAERVMQAERNARIVESCLVLLDDCIADRPGREGKHPALDLARWASEANALIQDVKRQPSPVRSETRVAERCLKLKSLVDEAEMARLLNVERAAARSCMDDALEVNKDLINRARRFGRDDEEPIFTFDSNPVSPDGWVRGRFLDSSGASLLAAGRVVADARRAPVAALTPDLVSDNLLIPGAPLAGRCAADLEPVSSRGAKSAVAYLHDVFRSFFHGATMPRLLRKVLEKGRGLFSRARGGA